MGNDLEQEDGGGNRGFVPLVVLESRGLTHLLWDWEGFSEVPATADYFIDVPNSILERYRVLEDIASSKYLRRFGEC